MTLCPVPEKQLLPGDLPRKENDGKAQAGVSGTRLQVSLAERKHVCFSQVLAITWLTNQILALAVEGGPSLVARGPGCVLKLALPLCGEQAPQRPEWAEMEGEANGKTVYTQPESERLLIRNALP